MSRIPFHRPARMTPPLVPEGKTALASPPQRADPEGAASWAMLLLPLLSSISMAAYMVAYGRAWMILLGVAFVVTSIGITIGVRMQLRGNRRRKEGRQRERYDEYLADVRKQASRVAVAQRLVGMWRHPHPERLWAIATRRRRVWERRQEDPDFLRVRVGTGTAPLATPLSLAKQSDPTVELDPRSHRAAAEIVETMGRVKAQPAWVDLGGCGVVSVIGPREGTESVAQSMLAQLAVLHAPDDVRVAVVTGDSTALDWAKWLPHAEEPGAEPQHHEQEAVPLLAADFHGLQDHLQSTLDMAVAERTERASKFTAIRGADKTRQHLVVVVNDYDPAAWWARSPLVADLLTEAGPELGLHLVCLVDEERKEPGRVDVRVRVDAQGGLSLEGPTADRYSEIAEATVDEWRPEILEEVARALTPLRLSGEREQVLSEDVSLSGMLGFRDVAGLDKAVTRRGPDDKELLRTVIGVDGTGEPVTLDLKESAQNGIGPHGLIVGATGSGKSELLRTLLTGLAMTHSPDHLAFVLVDFKGGATFAEVTELPHVSGLITNLADDLALVDRMRHALQGEQQRRQAMLREAGNVDSVREYQLRQAAGGTDVHGKPLEPLPYLLVIVDEFGELLSQRPDFIELFVQIGRVGRSLGIHLLLATQRLDEGRLRGLESHLSYRICLRTFSVGESRAVIGTPDAYMLPSIPGSAYLKVDESVYERFRVAHVSAPYRAEEPEEGDSEPPVPVPYLVRGELPPVTETESEQVTWTVTGEDAQTELQAIVGRLVDEDAPGHQVWLPPLPAAFTLGPLLGDPQEDSERGLSSTHWPWNGELRFPAGVIDIPDRQEQIPLIIDLAGREGHVAMVGAPQSGKSTFLRTAMLSSMLTHTPDELQYYCIDMGGGGLHGLEDTPHVAGVAGRRDETRVRRILAEVARQVTLRERMFRGLRVQSAADFRTRRVKGELPQGTRAADIVLVIDNWGALHAADDTAVETLMDLASRGLGVGVHVWLTANRWAEIRVNLRDNIAGRIELHLNDPSESEVSRAAARELGATVPGRGLCSPGLIHHVALPRTDGMDTVEDLANAERGLVSRIADAWQKPAAPALRVLPERVTVQELHAPAELPLGSQWEETEPALDEGEVPIGLRESDLRPVGLNLTGGDPHFVVLGDSGSGKTAFVRMWMCGLAARHSARQVRFMVVDFRRSLLEVVPPEYIGSQGGDRELVAGQAAALADVLRERLPPAGITPRQLRERDWWEGPELYVVVDDYDLAGGSGMGQAPLAVLAEFLPQARELGLHLVLARRVGGSGRALMSDPLLSRLKEIGTDGLVLSGEHREGVLIANQRAQERPPGRGVLVRRKYEPTVVQIALDEERPPQSGTSDEAAPGPLPGTETPHEQAETPQQPEPAQKYV